MFKLMIKLVPWLIITGMYILIRFGGTTAKADWASDNFSMIIMWLVGSVLLTLFFSLSNYITIKAVFRKQAYGIIVLLRVFIVFVGLLFLSLSSRIMLFMQGQLDADQIVISWVERLLSIPTLIAFLYLIIATAIVSFIKQMSFMIGEQVLVNLLLGKYHIPKEEQRIFMFLSLKDSNLYAERLGHREYCHLIQDCFHDLTESAIACDVEIYQYVGDEAVLTWKLDKGIKQDNCVNVYYKFHQTLKRKETYYKKNYGELPVFIAGVNNGMVTVAEIGDIKRDIAYMSDVLNTASRIQSQCHEFNEPLLVSSYISTLLKNSNALKFTSLGSVLLKGKEKAVEILTVSPATNKIAKAITGAI